MTPDGDSLIVGGDPESQPSLTDNTTKASVNLAMCGTPCGFHWAKWLSPTSFALGSWSEADDYGHWMQGGLSIYSIRRLDAGQLRDTNRPRERLRSLLQGVESVASRALQGDHEGAPWDVMGSCPGGSLQMHPNCMLT